MIYLLAHQLSSGKKALAISKDNCFVGTEDLEQAKKLIPNWNGYHVAHRTWSTSATLYWMSYHPCIAAFKSMDDIEKVLQDGEERLIMNEHNIWGSARYTIIKDNAELNIVFDPKLIDEGVDTAKPFWEQRHQ